jgi:hypothetical protein
VVKLDPPNSLLEGKALTLIRDISRRTGQVNEMMRSREMFRASNQAISGYAQQLEGYDLLIQKWLDELFPVLDELEPLLGSDDD